MNQASDPSAGAATNAASELAFLYEQADAARATLKQLAQDVVDAEAYLGGNQIVQLREANEQLMLATLHAQINAETAALALSTVSRKAELDALTELPNRVLLLDRFARARTDAMRRNSRLALFFLDLNDFKQINDTLGHAIGDRVLRLAAHRLVSEVRTVDTVSRYGGDEFLILLPEVSQTDVVLVARKLIAALGVPFVVGEHVLHLSASIGVSLYPEDGEDADTLIDRADAAMYRAKKHGPGSFALHEQAPVDGSSARLQALGASVRQPSSSYKITVTEHNGRLEELCEANEQLVLAALGAQELQNAAEQALRRQTEFLAVVAHELRNPLAPISAAAALLGQSRIGESMLPRAQAIIERQVAHMARLVGDLLDVSRVNMGKLRLERRTVDMTGIIDAAFDTCRAVMEARRQHFEIQAPSCLLEVYGDPIRLVQIMSNLLDNASKYTPNGGAIELSIKVIDDTIVMTLSDSGIGIAAQALPNVFEPFVQDIRAIGFNGVGLGIGLTVVRELVEAHSGKVVAHSAGSGLGSQFVVTLPLDRSLGTSVREPQSRSPD